jgi:hypothetical protein
MGLALISPFGSVGRATKMHSVFSCGCSFQNAGMGVLAKQLQISWLAGTLDLTESTLNAKAEELPRRLRTVEQSVQDAQTQVQGDGEAAAMNTWLLL